MRTRRFITVILCGIGLIGALAGCGASQTAPLDATTQAYVGMLRAYYVPLVNANSPARACLRDTGNAQQAAQAQMMAGCRALFATELTCAQTFATQIAEGTAPASLQSADGMLRQAALKLATLLTRQVADVDAQDVAAFIASEDDASQVLYLFLAPIQQVNTDIHAGPPPLTPPLPILQYLFT
jgi:hypothetical protein